MKKISIRLISILMVLVMMPLQLLNNTATAEIINIGTSIQLPSFYDSGMIFQRNKPIIINGTALPGHLITAKILNGNNEISQNTVTSASDGTWKTSLPGMSGGYTKFSIQLLDNGVLSTTLNDIVIGELWLAAGQSNMQFALWQSPSAQNILANPTDEYLRYLDMPGNPVGAVNSGAVPYWPQTTINGAYWGNAKNNSSMLYMLSSVAYYFAKKLRTELDMPVGILNVPMGATSIYAWISRTAIDGNETVKSHLMSTGRYRTEANWNQAGEGNFTQLTAMYNQKVAPLTNLNIKGMIWYQGESDSWDVAGSYRDALNLLLSDYSQRFGFATDSMPLIYSHIAPLRYDMDSRSREKNAIFAEDMSSAWKDHPYNMAQIPSYDIPLFYKYTPLVTLQIGGDDSIHPYTKQPVGERMATAALGMLYGGGNDYTAPVYNSTSYSENALIVKFDHVGAGLSTSNGDLGIRGFSVAGADGIYVPAKAQIISSDTVRVWSDTVKNPLLCAYAFTEMNTTANLVSTFNGQDLFPAVPFRSIAISGATYYHPHDWTDCDLSQIWHSAGFGKDAKFESAWQKGILSQQQITLNYDTTVKTQGNSSLRVDYITDSNGCIDPAPKTIDDATGLPFADIDNDFSKFETLKFDVKNATGRGIYLGEMLIKGADGSFYRPYVLGTSLYSKSIAQGGDWQTVTLDLTKLNKIGADPSQIFPSSNLTSTSNIQFDFYDTTVPTGTTGTIYLDNFVFGFNPDKVEINKRTLFDTLISIDNIDTTHNTYSPERLSEYTNKVAAARDVMNNLNATQESVDSSLQSIQNDFVFNNQEGAGVKPQKISLGCFYNAAGSTMDVKSDMDGNLIQELNTSWSGQAGQLVRTVGVGANLTQAPFLVVKIKSAEFPFQLLFRYKGGEFDDGNRTFLMVQDASQVSATEKTYVFDLRNYFRTDIATGSTVTTPYGTAWGQTRNIAITSLFEECSINFVSTPDTSNQIGDKIVVSDIYLSPTGNTSDLNAINMDSYNKVPARALRIPNSTISQYTPTAVFNGDNTISLTAAAGSAVPMIISFEGVDISRNPILFIDFKSAPTGVFIDFVSNPSMRLLNSITHPLQNFVVAIDLRNIYLKTDNKVLYLYNWNGYGTPSTMIVNGLYTAPENVDSSYYNPAGNSFMTSINPGTTATAFKNTLQPASELGFLFKDINSSILNDNNIDKVGTGTTVDIAVGGVSKRFSLVVYGDIDGDGIIGISDLASLKSHVLRIKTLGGASLLAGQITSNGKIGINDLLAIKKQILQIKDINQNK